MTARRDGDRDSPQVRASRGHRAFYVIAHPEHVTESSAPDLTLPRTGGSYPQVAPGSPLTRPSDSRITHDLTPDSPVVVVASPSLSDDVPRARVGEYPIDPAESSERRRVCRATAAGEVRVRLAVPWRGIASACGASARLDSHWTRSVSG